MKLCYFLQTLLQSDKPDWSSTGETDPKELAHNCIEVTYLLLSPINDLHASSVTKIYFSFVICKGSEFLGPMRKK